MDAPIWQTLGFASAQTMAMTTIVIHILYAGVVWAMLAGGRGRDRTRWTLGTLLGGLPVFAVLLLLPSVKRDGAA